MVGLILVAAVMATQAATGWLGHIAPGVVRMRDPTVDLAPWDGLVPRLKLLGQPEPGVVIAGTIWSDSAKLAYTLGPDVRVVCIGGDPRGFNDLTDQRSLLGRDILLVVRRRPGPETMVAYAPFFERLLPLGLFPASLGREEPVLSLYLGRRLRASVPPVRPL
jgi:hypothetical protein